MELVELAHLKQPDTAAGIGEASGACSFHPHTLLWVELMELPHFTENHIRCGTGGNG